MTLTSSLKGWRREDWEEIIGKENKEKKDRVDTHWEMDGKRYGCEEEESKLNEKWEHGKKGQAALK